jgi:hypothetical protein
MVPSIGCHTYHAHTQTPIGTRPHSLQYKKEQLAMAVRNKKPHYKLSEIL